MFSRWLTLIRGLVGSQKVGDRPVPFGPSEEKVVDTALKSLTGYTSGNSILTETTIPQLWHALDNPADELIASCHYASRQHFLNETRLLRDALGILVHGTLRGLFDDHTTIGLDWAAPIQSLSLSRLEGLGDEAVGMALLCLNSWGRAMRETADPGDMRIVVRDESWKQLRLGIEAVKSFDADLRLSRRDGDIQFAIAHKPSDLLTAGDAGSQAAAIAKDMLHLADTKILLGQDAAVADELEHLLGLGPIARDIVTNWARQAPGRRSVGRRRADGEMRHLAPPRRSRACLDERQARGSTAVKLLALALVPVLALLLGVPILMVATAAAVITPAVAEQIRIDPCSAYTDQTDVTAPDAEEGGLGFTLPRPGSPRYQSLHSPAQTIPGSIKALYLAAAQQYQLPWQLLAGIGMAETRHGRNNQTSSAGAQGVDAVHARHLRRLRGSTATTTDAATFTATPTASTPQRTTSPSPVSPTATRASCRRCGRTTTRSATATTSCTTRGPTPAAAT